MLLRIMSDLHLEHCFGYRPTEVANEKEMTLVLAGDICEFEKITVLSSFITDMCQRFKYVIYVPGNHEYYNGHLVKSKLKIVNELPNIDNLYILDDKLVTLDGINFIGATLWTDMNNKNPMDMLAVQQGLNDYHKIRTEEYRKILPLDTIDLFEKSVNFIQTALREHPDEANVVVTHHLPCVLSVNEKFKGSPINAGFVSNLTHIIAEGKPLMWIHGHTHDSCDYRLFETRVVCNPRGYPLPYKFGEPENARFDDTAAWTIAPSTKLK